MKFIMGSSWLPLWGERSYVPVLFSESPYAFVKTELNLAKDLTMADVGYVVAGKGKAESLNSASHGSGRQMSRTEAFRTIKVDQHLEYLKQRGITLIGGGLDESPQAYKPIEQVIAAQSDLVDIIGIFQPRIVRMASDR